MPRIGKPRMPKMPKTPKMPKLKTPKPTTGRKPKMRGGFKMPGMY